eukprot:gene14482-16625_t
MLQLYIANKNYSSWSMRPWVLLRQAGIAFDEVFVRFDSFAPDSQFKAALKDVNPVGKVPVLVHDGLAVWDTLAIAEYVAEQFPEKQLWPADRAARARARSICAEMHSGFVGLRSACPMNIEAHLPDVGALALRDKPAVRADLARICSLWSGLLQEHGGPMLFGPFTVADAYFAPVVMRLKTYALPVPADVAAMQAFCTEGAPLLDVALDDQDKTSEWLRRGQVLAEGWWEPYGPQRRHMTHSLTKSVTVCAVGMAVAEGRFGLDDKVVSFFPEHLPPVVSPNLAAMTVRDLLTMRTGHAAMTSGSVWRQIRTSWIAEFFKIPVVNPPGTQFVYTSAATYMLSAIVTKTTGQPVADYLKPRFFDPLGITGYEWEVGPEGISPGANGLSWKTVDSLKLGILHAQNGLWNGRQVLTKEWVDAVHQPHTKDKYGYQWWLGPNGAYNADGLFGQYAVVFPAHDAVLAINAALPPKAGFNAGLLYKHSPAAFENAPADGGRASAALR